MDKQPFISVIVPVYNGAKFLSRCLDALFSSSYPLYEVIVVDDASTDDSANIAREKGAKVLCMERRSGPAAARNYGVQHARGDVIFFIDADVEVKRQTIAVIAADFGINQGVAAVFGSYDDEPEEKNFISQYKNLQHHFVHQQSKPDAATFWAGCGAVRREVFNAVGGFDQVAYAKPSIEDIELGYRLRRFGYRILLDKGLQVKHLKEWRFRSLLKADIFYRAIPWSKLILRQEGMINDLNLQTSDRISAGLVGLCVMFLLLSLFIYKLLFAVPIFLGIIVFLNRKFYTFFLEKKGLMFTVLALPVHLLYFLYSGVTFALCWVMYGRLEKRSSVRRREA
jgi:glycosyltransferase involved in cell wall biosynthesis